MKKIMLVNRLFIILLLTGYSLLTYAQDCSFGKIENMKAFTINQLDQQYNRYNTNAGFKAVTKQMATLGFKRLVGKKEFAWGYTGHMIYDTVLGTSPQPVEICVFDFYKKTPTGAQMASVIWRKVGGAVYKCYIIFPEGEKDIEKAFERSIEYYADTNNKLVKAKSFGRCWAKCVFKRFKASNCGRDIFTCAGAAAAAAAAGIGVTTPLALGIFGLCSSIFCLHPLAICLAYCY